MPSGVRTADSESGANNRLYAYSAMWHHHIMSTTAKPDPTPFEKFQQFAKKVLSVPKAEIDRRENDYKKQRAKQSSRPRPPVKPVAS